MANRSYDMDPQVGLSAPPHPTQLQVKEMFESLHPSFGDGWMGGATGCLVDRLERPCKEASDILAKRSGDLDPQVKPPTEVPGYELVPFYGEGTTYYDPELDAVVGTIAYRVVEKGGSTRLETHVTRQSLVGMDFLKKMIYDNKELIAEINKCMITVYGEENAKKLGEQTLENSPAIDPNLTSMEIRKKFGMSVTPYATGDLGPFVTGDDLYKPGTVYIGREYYSMASQWTRRGPELAGRAPLENAYVHELGNLLSRRLPPKHTYTTFGKPRPADLPENQGWDDDSGWQLQLCVFKN